MRRAYLFVNTVML